MKCQLPVLLGIATLCAMPIASLAADQPATETPAKQAAAASAEELAKWAAQLDADDYADRKAAADKLFAAGKAAIPALSKAAAGDSLEATARAMDVLKRHFSAPDAKDEAIKTAAKEALDKLAAGDHAASSRRAKEILKVNEPAPQPAQGGIVLGGGQIVINGALQVAGGGKRLSIKNNNGVKEIDAEEDGKKVKIVDSGEKGIKMEITTKKDDKESTEKIEAKDAQELKKKNEKAYDLFKQYTENLNAGGGMVQLQMGVMPGMGMQGIAMPAIAMPVPAMPAPPAAGPGFANPIDALADVLKSSTETIERLATKEQLKQSSEKSRDALKKQAAELKKQLAELEKRLETEK